MKNYTTTEQTENQQVTNSRAMYYALLDMAELPTAAAAARNSRLSNPRTERRSSKPKKGTATSQEVMNLYFEKSAARIFHLGRKSDFIASAEPSDGIFNNPRKQTIVMINGFPHKKVNGAYESLTYGSDHRQSEWDLEMYQYLFLLAENGPVAADIYSDLIVAATTK